MKNSAPLTVEEAARLLKVSKFTLYELIKRQEIPAQRVGRQFRIDPDILNNYLHGNIPKNISNIPTEHRVSSEELPFENSLESLVFIGSHEPMIELFADFWKHSQSPYKLRLEFKGSMDGLISLYHHQAQMSGIHLWDDRTKEYNLPYVYYILHGNPVTVINLVQRVQGFIVQPGNPLGLQTWEDLTRKGLRFINRQKGSGTRLRLDAYLKSAHISPAKIQGYEEEENTHLGVASRVANGQADVGIGVQSEAHRMGLDFIPLFQERYDLVFLHEKVPAEARQQIITILSSSAFHKAIERQEGYDTSLTGKILYQSEV